MQSKMKKFFIETSCDAGHKWTIRDSFSMKCPHICSIERIGCEKSSFRFTNVTLNPFFESNLKNQRDMIKLSDIILITNDAKLFRVYEYDEKKDLLGYACCTGHRFNIKMDSLEPEWFRVKCLECSLTEKIQKVRQKIKKLGCKIVKGQLLPGAVRKNKGINLFCESCNEENEFSFDDILSKNKICCLNIETENNKKTMIVGTKIPKKTSKIQLLSDVYSKEDEDILTDNSVETLNVKNLEKTEIISEKKIETLIFEVRNQIQREMNQKLEDTMLRLRNEISSLSGSIFGITNALKQMKSEKVPFEAYLTDIVQNIRELKSDLLTGFNLQRERHTFVSSNIESISSEMNQLKKRFRDEEPRSESYSRKEPRSESYSRKEPRSESYSRNTGYVSQSHRSNVSISKSVTSIRSSSTHVTSGVSVSNYPHRVQSNDSNDQRKEQMNSGSLKQEEIPTNVSKTTLSLLGIESYLPHPTMKNMFVLKCKHRSSTKTEKHALNAIHCVLCSKNNK